MAASAGGAGDGALPEGISAGGMPITTVMLKNVPRKHIPPTLLAEIQSLWGEGVVDFVYLPRVGTEPCNMGFAFVNLISPPAAEHALCALSGKRWRSVSSRRPIKASPAFIQGLAANVVYCAHKVPPHAVREHLPLVWHGGVRIEFDAAVQLFMRPGWRPPAVAPEQHALLGAGPPAPGPAPPGGGASGPGAKIDGLDWYDAEVEADGVLEEHPSEASSSRLGAAPSPAQPPLDAGSAAGLRRSSEEARLCIMASSSYRSACEDAAAKIKELLALVQVRAISF